MSPRLKPLEHHLFRRVRNDAKYKKKNWTLTEKEFVAIIHRNCRYCGRAPSLVFRRRGREFKWSGIDRKNNRHGYTARNAVPCCKECNTRKNNRTMAEFLRGPYQGRYLLKLDADLKSRLVAAAKAEHISLASWIRKQCSKAVRGH